MSDRVGVLLGDRATGRASWVDWIIDRIDHLAVPRWVPYTLLFLIPPALMVAPVWMSGRAAPAENFAFYLLIGFWTVFPLGLMHYLDRFSERALEAFRPACDLDEAEAAAVRRRLTTMPAGPAALAGLLGALFVAALYLAAPQLYQVIQASPAQFAIGFIVLSVNFALLGSLIYHTVCQLRLVSALYERARRLDLFHLTPLYAFSGLSARTAIAWALAIYLSAVLFPALTGNAITIAVVLLQIALLVAVFTFPLIGIHRRIQAAKDKAVEEVGASLQRTIRELNRRTEPLQLDEMDALNKLVTALIAGRDVLARVPTWPWSPGTPVAVGSALLLPVALFVIERVLAGFFGL